MAQNQLGIHDLNQKLDKLTKLLEGIKGNRREQAEAILMQSRIDLEHI